MIPASKPTVLQPATRESAFRNEQEKPYSAHLQIGTLQYLLDTKGVHCLPGEKLTAYEIVWIKNGEGLLTVDLRDHVLSEDGVICLGPGQYRSLHLPGDTEGYYIRFLPELLSPFELNPFPSINSISWNNPLVLQAERTMVQAEEVLLTLARELSSPQIEGIEIIKAYFRVFMLYLNKNVVKEGTSPFTKDAGLVRQFMSLLKANFIDKKTVTDYAGELGVTPAYLNRVVKKVSGLPASYHIKHYIILEAKRMAQHSHTSMKEIAYALGFADNAHFSKFFKSYTGMNFSSFRRVAH